MPTDADSTAWALVDLSSAATWRPSAVLRGTRFLARHQDAGGGMRTYDRGDGIHRFIAAPPEAVPGWAQPHICVTAAGLLALASHRYPDQESLARAASYVRETRNDDGCWSGYWWPGIANPTAMALRAPVAARGPTIPASGRPRSPTRRPSGPSCCAGAGSATTRSTTGSVTCTTRSARTGRGPANRSCAFRGRGISSRGPRRCGAPMGRAPVWSSAM
ncbi:hypothetical protein [Streptomyces alboniger]|uniref:hypothetical protein n=1 Tax=Streptomyces alboniger TaxID=132473 RepID=UPI000B24C9F3|nr:hypothetical protein [Streptomyces alboniger]